jgi:hypothetical protein
MKNFLLSLLALMMSVVTFGQLENVEKQLIVVPVKGQEQQMYDFVNSSGCTIAQKYDQLNWYLIQIPDGSNQEDFLKKFDGESFCQKVYKDEIMEYTREYIPSDANFNLAWHLKQSNDADIDADEAWDLVSNNGGYTTVAVFDGGFETTHEDLVGNYNTVFDAVTNLPYSGQFANSFDRHGVACAGTIAAVTNNNIGVASVGNNLVQVMPINIMAAVYSGGSFSTSSSIQINAINAAMANPTCVAISMSYSGSSFSQALSDAFTTARTTARGGKGILCFASSGNGYSGTATNYPAWYSSVWGVGATGSSDTKASFSNFGQICDISAPGVSIITTDRIGTEGYSTTSNYATVSGTSFSCPITAGAAALVAYRNSSLTADQIMTILAQSCDKVGGYTYSSDPNFPLSTRSNELGYGRINLKTAILMAPDGGTPPPPPVSNHDIILSNPLVNPNSALIGSTITISCKQMTMNSSLSQVNSIVQYRLSTNSIWGDSDDIIIGTDTTTLGGGISSGNEDITYTVPNSPGLKYILFKANFNNAIVETNYSNNNGQVQFFITQPTTDGLDLSLTLNAPTSTDITLTATQVAVNFQYKFTNNGSTPITGFTWERRWVNCTSNNIYFPCVRTTTWPANGATGVIQPGESIILPNGINSWSSENTCPQLANPNNSTCFVPAGGNNTFRISIISVNGTPDSNPINNVKEVNFTRLSVSDAPNIYSVDPTYIEIYTITGMLLDQTRWDELPTGIYVIKEVYPDQTIVTKKIK